MQIIFSSAVIASLLTGICSLIIAISTNKKVVKLEHVKLNNEIQKDRYIELKKYSSVIRDLPKFEYMVYDSGMNYSEEKHRLVVRNITERFNQMKDIYEITEPLIEDKYLKNTREILKKESKISEKLITCLHSNTLNLKPGILNELNITRIDFEKELKQALSNQIASIVK